MRTSAAVTTATVDVVGLPQRVHAVNVHREMQIRPDGPWVSKNVKLNLLSTWFLLYTYFDIKKTLPDIMPSQLVGLMYAFGMPVSPKERVFKDGDGKRVRQPTFHHPPAAGSIQSDALDDVVLRVGPVIVVDRVVDG